VYVIISFFPRSPMFEESVKLVPSEVDHKDYCVDNDLYYCFLPYVFVRFMSIFSLLSSC